VRALSSKAKSSAFNYSNFFIKGTTTEVRDLELMASKLINVEKWKKEIKGDSVTGYANWPVLEGLSSLYKATGNIEYIEASVQLAMKFIESGTKRDVYYEWESSWIGEKYGHGVYADKHGHGHVEWRAAAGIATLVQTIHSDPILMSKYEAIYVRMLRILESHIWEKTEAGLMPWNDMLNEAGKHQVTHFIGRVGLVAIPLYQITKKKKYLDWIMVNTKIMKDLFFKNKSFPFNCKTNDYNCIPDKKAIDTSHANDTIAFIHLAYKNSFFFSKADMVRLSIYVKDVLWNKDFEIPKFYDYLDGENKISSKSIGENQGAWSILGTYDLELRKIYLNWLKNSTVSEKIKLHAIGNMALSAYGD